MKFDMHMHTCRHSPCSVTDPFELVERAVQAGLDGIVITEHHHLWTDVELEPLRRAAPGLIILAGIEVTCVGGDVLVYGVTNPHATRRGMEWPELAREVRRQGGACVVAHPYRWDQPVDQLLDEKRPEFDGLELMSTNMDPDVRAKAAALHLRRPHFAALANSDSHHPHTVGACYTEFPAGTRTMADIVAAIRGRQTRPIERAG